MLVLVLGASFPVMFVGWEGVGLCSYLLIGFWYHEAVRGRRRQEGVHRQPHRRLRLHPRHGGDLRDVPHAGLPAGGVPRRRSCRPETTFGLLTGITLLLFLGATGKSAQLPALRLVAGRDGRPDARSRRSSTPRRW